MVSCLMLCFLNDKDSTSLFFSEKKISDFQNSAVKDNLILMKLSAKMCVQPSHLGHGPSAPGRGRSGRRHLQLE
jgi:hypothetical protein